MGVTALRLGKCCVVQRIRGMLTGWRPGRPVNWDFPSLNARSPGPRTLLSRARWRTVWGYARLDSRYDFRLQCECERAEEESEGLGQVSALMQTMKVSSQGGQMLSFVTQWTSKAPRTADSANAVESASSAGIDTSVS